MSSLRNLIGRKVMDRGRAEQIGKVSGVVVETSGGDVRIASLRLSGAGDEHEFADWDHVTGSGEDAVVVDGVDNLHPPRTPLEERLKGGDAELLGKRLLSDHGNEMGKVDDVDFDGTSGRIEHLVARNDRIEGSRLRSIGPYAVIVTCPHEGGCPG